MTYSLKQLTFVVTFLLCLQSGVSSSILELLPPTLIMPWFCTQRCGYNVSQVKGHIEQAAHLATHEGVTSLNTVAFERYNLGPNCTLIFNADLFDINAHILQNATLTALFPRRIAMISSDPYPPQFLDWMRQLFANPQDFITIAIGELNKANLTGYNVDWEPATGNATLQDALNYASFLNNFRTQLAAAGKVLTVAGATWSNIWDLPAIAAVLAGKSLSLENNDGNTDVTNNNDAETTIGYFTSMNTYTYNDTEFAHQLRKTVNIFSTNGTINSLVVGLETWPGKFSAQELETHFQLLAKDNVCRIAIWDMPLTAGMIPHLAALSARCARATPSP